MKEKKTYRSRNLYELTCTDYVIRMSHTDYVIRMIQTNHVIRMRYTNYVIRKNKKPLRAFLEFRFNAGCTINFPSAPSKGSCLIPRLWAFS